MKISRAPAEQTRARLGIWGAHACSVLVLAFCRNELSSAWPVPGRSLSSKRLHEIGIRIALGARSAQVGALIMNHALRLLLLGCVLGFAGGLAVSRVLESVLFESGAADPQIYFIVAGILLLATLLASWVPARRACKVDPIVALRVE